MLGPCHTSLGNILNLRLLAQGNNSQCACCHPELVEVSQICAMMIHYHTMGCFALLAIVNRQSYFVL
jgi:hypothetical protein